MVPSNLGGQEESMSQFRDLYVMNQSMASLDAASVDRSRAPSSSLRLGYSSQTVARDHVINNTRNDNNNLRHKSLSTYIKRGHKNTSQLDVIHEELRVKKKRTSMDVNGLDKVF